MEAALKRLDIEKTLGRVELTDGKNRLDVPRLSMSKIIQIVKFLGIDGAKLYDQSQKIIADKELDDVAKIALVLEGIEDKQLIRIFSILLDLDDEDALQLDINEMLDVILVYVEKTNIAKTFSQVRQLYKVMFKKELPDIQTWLKQRQEMAQELQQKRLEAQQTVEQEEQKEAKQVEVGTN